MGLLAIAADIAGLTSVAYFVSINVISRVRDRHNKRDKDDESGTPPSGAA